MITRLLLLVAAKTVEELFNEGKYIDAAIQAYTDSVGPRIFFGLFFLAIAGAFIIRSQSFNPLIALVIILFPILLMVLPPTSFGLVMGVILIVGAGVIYRLIVREKQP